MLEEIITGNIVDVENRRIFFGNIIFSSGLVKEIKEISEEDSTANYIIPGFIDSHIHIESSMLVPSKFAELAVVHGTTGTISDPHEIGNVCGVEGVNYMIEDSKQVPVKFHFGAPSCVPSINQDKAGAIIDADAVEALMSHSDIYYLSEMMNYPGVIFSNEEVLKKLSLAKKSGKPIDGHAPGVVGEDAVKYFGSGIGTDHECVTAEEALFKLNLGVKILIREGSAARNFDALIPLFETHYQNMMFCSDDKHPDSLVSGHINELCKRAVTAGCDVFKVLQAACINPILHYNMRNGKLQVNDAADAVVVNNLKDFKVLRTFIDGKLVADNGHALFETKPANQINNFSCSLKDASEFNINAIGNDDMKVIEALDGQLITNHLNVAPTIVDGNIISDITQDILKIVVVNRYGSNKIGKGFVKGTGIKVGAIASSVSHDAHNIVAIGVTDEDIAAAVNLVISTQGGVAAAIGNEQHVLPLKIAGLMSDESGIIVAEKYSAIERFAKEKMGSTLFAPFMTLSFLALPVIPHLKIIDGGLFDVDKFEFTSLQ